MPIHGVHVGKRRERSPIHVLVPAADEAQRPPRTSSKAPGRTAAWRGEARSLSAEADAVRAGGRTSQRGGAGVWSGREGRRPRVLSGAPRRRSLSRYPPVFRRPSGPNRPSEEHRFRLAQGLGRPCKAAGWRRGPRRDWLSRTPAPAPAPAQVVTLQSSSRVRASGRMLGRERTHLVLSRWDVPSRSVSGLKEARSARLGWGGYK